jgi:hypothetical protein
MRERAAKRARQSLQLSQAHDLCDERFEAGGLE